MIDIYTICPLSCTLPAFLSNVKVQNLKCEKTIVEKAKLKNRNTKCVIAQPTQSPLDHEFILRE
jgi:hypothetical protein